LGASYDGAVVSISGKVSKKAETLVRVTGALENSRFKKKGRALGFLWMNMETVEIEQVPNVFLVYSSNDLMEDQNPENAESEVSRLCLEAVRKQARIESAYENKDELFDEFIKLKKKSGLYALVGNGIRYTGEVNGELKSFSCDVTLPASLPQGKYKVEVYSIEDGMVTGHAEREIKAEEVGIPAWISSLAFQHGTLYGILAVLVAVCGGLLMGVLFKGEKAAH